MIFGLILLLCGIIKSQFLLVNQGTVCHCNQFTSQDSCLQMGQSCTWTNNQCSTSPCSSFQQSKCNMMPNCSWISQKCTNFVNCENLFGTSISTCQSYNVECTYVYGATCLARSQINCSEYYMPQDCTYAGNSLCYLYEMQCKPMTSCSQQTQEQLCTIQNTFGACYWNNAASKCVPYTCAMQVDCQTILASPSNLQEYQICVSSDQTYCQNGNPYDLTQENCLQQTFYTYTWIEIQESQGVQGICYACINFNYEKILNFVIIMIIFQI